MLARQSGISASSSSFWLCSVANFSNKCVTTKKVSYYELLPIIPIPCENYQMQSNKKVGNTDFGATLLIEMENLS